MSEDLIGSERRRFFVEGLVDRCLGNKIEKERRRARLLCSDDQEVGESQESCSRVATECEEPRIAD